MALRLPVLTRTSQKDEVLTRTSQKDEVLTRTSQKDEVLTRTSQKDEVLTRTSQKDEVLTRTSQKDEVDSRRKEAWASQTAPAGVQSASPPALGVVAKHEPRGPAVSQGGEAADDQEEDEEPSESDEEDEVHREEEEVTSAAVKLYQRAARRLGVTPLRKVLTQLGKERMTFRNLTLTARDMKALCIGLLKERETVELDFSGNYIGGRECDYLVWVLSRTDNIETLDVSNNCLSGKAIRCLSTYISDSDNLTFLDISGNKLIDSDAQAVASFLTTNSSLRTLVMNNNEFRESGGRLIGRAIGIVKPEIETENVNHLTVSAIRETAETSKNNATGKNGSLEELELRWNHLRRDGAIGIAKGLEENRSLKRVDLAWNGFGFEGCVALSDALARNYVIEDLDISSNRINPPALMELVRGLALNKTLQAIRIGQNPITASFSSVILNTIRRHPAMAVNHLDMKGIVVDRDFETVLDDIRKTRLLHVNYDVILPVRSTSREEMLRRIQAPGAYNLDPLHMFFLLKEKMRASDFFYKINKDKDGGVSRDELNLLFQEAGIPVTGSVIDAIVGFMDTDGDGTIDLAEFMTGDKKLKKISRLVKPTKEKKKKKAIKDDSYSKYSRTFKKTEIDPVTLSVKVTKPSERLKSIPGNPASLPRLDEDEG